MNYLHLPIGPGSPGLVNAVIEVPFGEVNKYEYDRALHVFRLDRPLFASVHYPGDYGFVPSTLGDDGDALDILVLSNHPAFPGCVMEVRPIAVLDMEDQGLADEKILAVGANTPQHKAIHNGSDVEPHILREIEHFFAIYKELEGKRTKIIGWRDVHAAGMMIQTAHEKFLAERRAGAPPAKAASSRRASRPVVSHSHRRLLPRRRRVKIARRRG